MSIPFVLEPAYKASVVFADVGIEMVLAYAADYLIDGIPFDYALPPGGIIDNSEVEYNAMVFNETIKPKPSWATLSGTYFNAWKAFYRSQYLSIGQAQDYVSTAIALKAAITDLAAKADVSHSHIQSDVTNLVTSLAGKANLSHNHSISELTDLAAELNKYVLGEGYLAKVYRVTLDSNSEALIHLTADGTSGGAALFNTTTVPSVTGLGFGAVSAVNAPNVYATAWSNGNKSVTVKGTKGVTLIALGATAQLSGSGVVVDVVVIGPKA